MELKRKRNFSSNLQEDKPITIYRGSELLKRLLTDRCELCNKEEHTEVHHIRKINDLKRRCKGKEVIPEWKKEMITKE